METIRWYIKVAKGLTRFWYLVFLFRVIGVGLSDREMSILAGFVIDNKPTDRIFKSML